MVFQFHKGAIKTFAKFVEDYYNTQFQFHKGAIKTVRVSVIGSKHICFNSIKVRLRPRKALGMLVLAMFQFHKGAIKTQLTIDSPLLQKVFQFHKGAIKTCYPRPCAINREVSIP